MAEPKRDRAVCLGVVIVCLVILVFLALTRCQANFFQNAAPVF